MLHHHKMISLKPSFLLCCFMCAMFLCGAAAHAAEKDVAVDVANTTNDKVDLTSDNLFYDDVKKIVIAEGAVEIIQNGKIVKADRVEYEIAADKVVATGNVVLVEINGDTYFADRLQLTDKMKNGTVNEFRTMLKDGSRFNAKSGERVDGTRIIMNKADYTPCEPCKFDPSKPPVWQIKADKLVHDSKNKSITYNDATFELGGVPIFYTPYFSHPDGTEKQKRGFLTPTFSLSSDLGFGVTSQYYLPVNETEDITIGARVFSKQTPVLLAEHRKRYNNARIETNVSASNSSRLDSVSGKVVDAEKEWRGHLFSEGQLDINQKWRAGYGVQLTSDDQYLRQYDLSAEDILENELYLEKFDDRDYFSTRAIAFQDVRASSRSTDQPNIIPEIKANFTGKPNDTLGGRWSVNSSLLGLARKGNGQDVMRASSEMNWQRRDILNDGLLGGAVNTLTTSARADIYNVPKRDVNLLGSGGDGDATSFRFVPYIQNVTAYPLVKRTSDAQWLVEPTLSIKVSPNIKNDTDIPNEDSQDVQLDSNNIFAADRFPGLDRVEDRANITYGSRGGWFKDDGSFAEIFLGQSHRMDDKDNPFPSGSGLDKQTSNYVGQISSRYKSNFNLDYKFELDQSSLAPNRHEVDGGFYWGRFGFNTTYLYARALAGTDLLISREQLFGGASYQVNDQWRVSTSARYELSDTVDKGLRGGALSVDYLGQCLNFNTTIDRSVVDSISGEQALEVMMRIGLKNLGEFGVKQ